MHVTQVRCLLSSIISIELKLHPYTTLLMLQHIAKDLKVQENSTVYAKNYLFLIMVKQS